MLDMSAAVRTGLLGMVTVEPLAKAAVAEGMTALGRVRFIHRLDADCTGHAFPQVVHVGLKDVGEVGLRWIQMEGHCVWSLLWCRKGSVGR